MKKFILVTIATLLLLTPAIAREEDPGQQGQTNEPNLISGQGSSSQKCTDVSQRVGQISDRYDQNKEKYMNAYQNIFQNMESLMLKLKANGLDTSKMEADLNQFNNMIQNANRYYNSFQSGMENSKNSVCGNGNSDPVQEMNQAREQLALARNEMLQLRTFAQETLKQDLLQLREQITQ
jgi:Skp family chaperone for outer membrane proteins